MFPAINTALKTLPSKGQWFSLKLNHYPVKPLCEASKVRCEGSSEVKCARTFTSTLGRLRVIVPQAFCRLFQPTPAILNLELNLLEKIPI